MKLRTAEAKGEKQAREIFFSLASPIHNPAPKAPATQASLHQGDASINLFNYFTLISICWNYYCK